MELIHRVLDDVVVAEHVNSFHKLVPTGAAVVGRSGRINGVDIFTHLPGDPCAGLDALNAPFLVADAP